MYADSAADKTKSKVSLYNDNHKKIAAGRPKPEDLPANLLKRIRACPRYQIELEFYNYAVALHNKRTAKLPKFSQRVNQFIEACNANKGPTPKWQNS